MYSTDTSAFYTDEEWEIQNVIYQKTHEKILLKSENEILSAYQSNTINLDVAKKQFESIHANDNQAVFPIDVKCRISEIKEELRYINGCINESKGKFKETLRGYTGVRVFRQDELKESNVIAIFESALTRTLGINTNNLSLDLLVVRVYFYEILKDLMVNGFTLNGERYVFFTASAGQIRTKKVVFIKESQWEKHRDTLMCGLTPEIIEAKGGTNRNKYLAYLALCNSATDEWKDFDIRKSIVVDDMETLVNGLVDYIDETTFDIKRQTMDVPICHTDGCGMVLPRVSKVNFMFRAPWVKGLLASFPFDQFILEANSRNPSKNHGLITDIYGEQHDVLAEGIEVIFTKSQFKMAKFYDNWHDYIDNYIRHGCSAGTCNVEEPYIPRSKVNYQVLQTLTDISDEEISKLADKTVRKIENIATSRTSKLEAFGATKENPYKNDFQECLLMYPELLSTGYIMDTLRQIKDSLVKEGRAGKLDIEGKYLFIIPDLYAFCEWLFLGDKNPNGLLADGEVFCAPYAKYEKLDCLRSPHLYREHGVRRNVVDDEKRKWFTTAGVYTSCHDLLSKLLMFDVDGDKSLVVADPLFVEIAERNMQGIVPLQYKMGKAGATPLSPESLYDGMILAYTGGGIGIISNSISKIWNSESPNYDAIRILCAYNNYVIDYAKTLYKPVIPHEKQKVIDCLTGCKTPHFFMYAKDKTEQQVEQLNNSVVNRLERIIPNRRMKNTAISKAKFRYIDLMSDKSVVESKEIIEKYNDLYRKFRGCFNKVGNSELSTLMRDQSTTELSDVAGSPSVACDMLIHYLFKTTNSKRQKLFWLCFSSIVLDNLKSNLAGTLHCANCGARTTRETNNQKLCNECAGYHRLPNKELICSDCGDTFVVAGIVKNKKRCSKCQVIKDAERYRRYNEKRK